MLTAYESRNGMTRKVPVAGALPEEVSWVDVSSPTPEERVAFEQLLKIRPPTHDEMHRLEMSSRFYFVQGALYMFVEVAAQPDAPRPETHTIAIILTRKQLVTVRFTDIPALAAFETQVLARPGILTSSETALLHLIETLADTASMLLKGMVSELESISKIIFWDPLSREDRFLAKTLGTRSALYGIGHAEEMSSSAQRSLVSIDRLLAFYKECVKPKPGSAVGLRIHRVQRDVRSLNEHAIALSQKTTFLMDATTGLITAEQNQIIKIFSVAAVIFLPPTLIASVYGMNFLHMPELAWQYGYAFAVGMMIFAGIVPYMFFKYRRWI